MMNRVCLTNSAAQMLESYLIGFDMLMPDFETATNPPWITKFDFADFMGREIPMTWNPKPLFSSWIFSWWQCNQGKVRVIKFNWDHQHCHFLFIKGILSKPGLGILEWKLKWRRIFGLTSVGCNFLIFNWLRRSCPSYVDVYGWK